jgi:hypothetical protein
MCQVSVHKPAALADANDSCYVHWHSGLSRVGAGGRVWPTACPREPQGERTVTGDTNWRVAEKMFLL